MAGKRNNMARAATDDERLAWETLTPEQIDEALAAWTKDAPAWARGLPFAQIVDPLDKDDGKAISTE